MQAAYTTAVLDLLKRGVDPSKVFRGLQTTLQARGHGKLYARIIRQVARRLPHALRPSVKLTVAREADVAHYEEAIQAAMRSLNATEQPIVVIDDALIGGFIAESADQRVDQSHHRKLRSLYQSVINR